MKLRLLLVSGAFCALAALLSGACTPQSEESGTNTNWLRTCQEDAECGAQGSCLCGRCTLGCEANSACMNGNVCTEAVASLVQCKGESLRTCQPPCTNHDQCESGRRCLDGSCVDPLSSSCPSSALYCEDFEQESTAATRVVTSGNELEREPVVTPSGGYALRARITAGPSVAYLRSPLTPIQTSGTVYLSGWVRVPGEAAYNVAPLALWSANEEDWALRLTLQDARLDIWSKTAPLTSSIQLERDRWYCVGAAVTIADAPNGRVTLSVNGEEVAGANEVDTLPSGGIQAVTVGTLWSNSPAQVVVDRVIVSNQPISCY